MTKFGHYTLVNGVWVRKGQGEHLNAEPPDRSASLAEGAPAVHVPTPKPKVFRKFDAPSEHDIKRRMKEDDDERAKITDVTPLVYQTKKDLESGKIQVDDRVLNQREKRFNANTSIVDEKGRIHVLPLEAVTEEIRKESERNESKLKSFEQIKAEAIAEKHQREAKQLMEIHDIKPPTEGNSSGDDRALTDQAAYIEQKLMQAKLEGRANLRKRTY